MGTRPRAIFFGTPAFCVPALEALYDVAEVVLVVTQPDRPAGRGMQLAASPVKELALERGSEIVQPRKVRTTRFAERLREARADVGVVVAYGRILPVQVLSAPRLGCVNLHASLLPRWRGAAPINWAIVHGDRETGVCLMQMDEGMDTGPVLARVSTAIGADETAGDVSSRLSALAAQLLREQLPRFVAGELEAAPQPASGATTAPVLRKSDAQIDWNDAARVVYDRIRGMTPWPGAYTWLGEQMLKVHRAHVLVPDGRHGAPGSVVRADAHGIDVACVQGVVTIDELQLPGRKRVSAAQFCAGQRVDPGTQFDVREPDA